MAMYLESYFCLFAFSWVSLTSFAETSSQNKTPKIPKNPGIVKHVGDSTRGPYVVIESGTKRGFKLGQDICFYNTEDEETGCGSVEEANPKASGIRLPIGKKHFVAQGQRAWSSLWGPLPSLDGFVVSSSENSDVESLIEAQEEQEPPEPSVFIRRISYGYVAALKVPATVHALKFNAQAKASGQGSIWESGDAQNRSLVGFGIYAHLPRPGKWETQVGFSYNFLPQTPVKADYDLTDGSTNVVSSVTGHFYNFHWSRGLSLLHSEQFDVLFHAGLELNFVVHKFSAEHSEGTSFAQGSLYNGLLSIPLSPSMEWHMGGWIGTFALDTTMPITMFGKRISGDIGYDEDSSAEKDLSAVKDAMNVQKNFGYAIRIGLGAKI